MHLNGYTLPEMNEYDRATQMPQTPNFNTKRLWFDRRLFLTLLFKHFHLTLSFIIDYIFFFAFILFQLKVWTNNVASKFPTKILSTLFRCSNKCKAKFTIKCTDLHVLHSTCHEQTPGWTISNASASALTGSAMARNGSTSTSSSLQLLVSLTSVT